MLTEQQEAILHAVVDVIIPPDEDPGGWSAGVGIYLFRQFEHDLYNVLGLYQTGLLAIDSESHAVFNKSFTDLTPDQQEALMYNLENGIVETVWTVDPTSFFRLLCEHCAEGYYSDPNNGGNIDLVAWKMIGFEVTA